MIRREISQGQKFPRFYGVAWIDYERGFNAICYPIPINFLISAFRSVWFFLQTPPRLEMERIAEENICLRQHNTMLRSERHELAIKIRKLKREIAELEGDDECQECWCDPCECDEE